MVAKDRDLNTRATRLNAAQASGAAGAGLRRAAAVRRAGLIVYWLGMFFLTHWPRMEDFPRPQWLFPHFDLVVHFGLYGVWAAAWAWVLIGEGRWAGWRTAKWVVAGGAAYSIFDELTQLIVGRDAQIGDFMADLAGVVVVLMLVGWWLRRREGQGRRGPIGR